MAILRRTIPPAAAALLVLILSFQPVFMSAVAASASSTTVSGTQTSGMASVSSNPPSDGVGASVTITGGGFPASKNVTATFDGSSLPLSGTCITDRTGSISGCSFRVPQAGSGPHQIVVQAGPSNAMMTFTIPSVAPPESTFLVTLTAVGLTLVTQLVTKRLVDLGAERRMKAELAAFNKEKRDATVAEDKPRLEKLKKRELQMRQEQAKVSFARLKVSAITIVPLLVVYYLMASFLGGYNVVVAHAPPIPYIVNPDGTMVLFWWYMLSSFTFSAMLSRLLHTTT